MIDRTQQWQLQKPHIHIAGNMLERVAWKLYWLGTIYMTGGKKSQLSRSKNSVYLEKVWEGALRVPEAVHPLNSDSVTEM